MKQVYTKEEVMEILNVAYDVSEVDDTSGMYDVFVEEMKSYE